ncbi:hypothetical protein [Caballeronia sp. Lep1P3]|uniref:hypothetical protein n=1 Tax=Caballeronia sp. Lep1P3 TaxID=2878150 RepID=UPI001FD08C92|nr:hypothetical protein [Caballeronia sp. Lep1P3]
MAEARRLFSDAMPRTGVESVCIKPFVKSRSIDLGIEERLGSGGVQRKYEINWFFPMHGPAMNEATTQIIDG